MTPLVWEGRLEDKILDVLEKKLTLADPGLIGCRRRGKWSAEDEVPWRRIRGNAVLDAVGYRDTKMTPFGDVEYYTYHGYLLQFRGGPWNMDWIEDMYDLWALTETQNCNCRTILVFHEYKGEISLKKVEVPENLNSEHRIRKMMEEYRANPPGRIPKSGERARRICPHCPHKQRCDAEDILQGQTDDWSPTYPQP